MDNEEVSQLKDEIGRLSSLLEKFQERLEDVTGPTERPASLSLPKDMDSPWSNLCLDGDRFEGKFTFSKKENGSVILKAKASWAKIFNLDQFSEQRFRRKGTRSIWEGLVMIKADFLRGALTEWRGKNSDRFTMRPNPMPIFSSDDGESFGDVPFLMCKLVIREGSYVRFHLSTGWSHILWNTEAGRRLLDGGAICPNPRVWVLDVSKSSNLALPCKVKFARDVDGTVRINPPSWWKLFQTEKSLGLHVTHRVREDGNDILLYAKLASKKSQYILPRKSSLFHILKKFHFGPDSNPKGAKIIELMVALNHSSSKWGL